MESFLHIKKALKGISYPAQGACPEPSGGWKPCILERFRRWIVQFRKNKYRRI